MGSTKSRSVRISKERKIEIFPPNNELSRIGEHLYIPNSAEVKQLNKLTKVTPKKLTLQEQLTRLKAKKTYKGFPQKMRWEFWKLILSVKVNREEYILLGSSTDYEHDIDKDLDRTFPKHPYFDKSLYGYYGQFALKRILLKLSNKYATVGYCQGMNYIVGFLLIVSGGLEEEVFYFLEALYEKFQLYEFFTQEMKGLRHSLYIFNKMFESMLCKLYWHFKNEEISDEMWIFKYFLTLFTSNTPIRIAVCIWDLFLLDGFENIYKVMISLLKLHQNKLIKLASFEILEFFNNNFFICDPEYLLKHALKIKFSSQKKEKYERQYKSLPCQFNMLLEIDKDHTTEISSLISSPTNSPAIKYELIIEEPPIFLRKFKTSHPIIYKHKANPFLIEESLEDNEGSIVDESFNAEDVLNNLLIENDWEQMYNH